LFDSQYSATHLAGAGLNGRLKAFIFLIFGLAASDTMALGYTLKLSEADLQKRVSAMMPIEKKQLFMTVIVSDPTVSLLAESDQVSVFLNVEAIAPGGLKGSGRGRVLGKLHYDKSKGAFFLQDPKLDQLVIDRVPTTISQQISSVSQAMITATLASYPLYTLNDKDFKQKMAKSMIESIVVKDQHLLIKFGSL